MAAEQGTTRPTGSRPAVNEQVLDGNALAGPLGEVFGIDLTAAQVTCSDCGRQQVVAQLVVYQSGMGSTARCRGCGQVMLRLARLRSDAVLDLTGFRAMRIPMTGGTA